MTDLQTIQVNGNNPADQLVAEGDPPTLIGNTDITNTLYISRSNTVIVGRPDTIAITPQSWIVVDGKEAVYGVSTGPVISVILAPGGVAFFQSGITGGGFVVNSNGAFFYAGAAGPGNLLCAITGTGASGTDQYGNPYTPGGMCIVAQPQATSLFSVVDNASPPNLLASIAADGSFSTEGQLNATDLTVGGLSLLNDILPPLPQGIIARTNVFANSLPAPATPAGELYLYELDVQLTAGRAYVILMEPCQVALSGAGRVMARIYATADGTAPTNASPVMIQSEIYNTGTTNFGSTKTPPIYHPFSPAASALYRLLVTLVPFNTGGGAPTLQMVQLDNTPTGATGDQVNARFEIYDMGVAVPNTGRVILANAPGSGGGTQNYTKTYTSNGSHCYQGSDGSNPNLKINDNGSAYVCGDRPNTYNGKAKTWYTFNTGPITSDLSGATINWVKIYLNNNHTWYGSGMTCPVGYDSKSSFGSTAGDPSGSGIDAAETHFNEGQAKWFTVPNAFASNFASGAANTIVLWRNTNSLSYYGFFAGNNGCQMQVNYTK